MNNPIRNIDPDGIEQVVGPFGVLYEVAGGNHFSNDVNFSDDNGTISAAAYKKQFPELAAAYFQGVADASDLQYDLDHANPNSGQNGGDVGGGASKKGVASQGGEPPKDSGGPLNPFSLMAHYMEGSGTPYELSHKAFMEFVVTLYMKHDGINFKNGTPVPGLKGLYKIDVSGYNTNLSYPVAVGSATLYYNSSGIVGYSDYWNFDAQPYGSRSSWAEEATIVGRNVGSITNGKPFWVYYGITPGLTSIPRN